ncbi:hypothetical protein GINT2_002090 [Glugoides intestinalis]
MQYYNEATNEFKHKSDDAVIGIGAYDVFIILDDKKLVASVYVYAEKGYSLKDRKAFDFLSFYYFMVSPQYRGQGFSYRLMLDSVNFLKKHYNLKEDAILALHVSPEDALMPIAAKTYYRLGFKTGVFVSNGPSDMAKSVDKLIVHSKDMLEVAENEELGYGKGPFFMMWCRLKDFKQYKAIPQNFMEKSRKLYEIMSKRKIHAK